MSSCDCFSKISSTISAVFQVFYILGSFPSFSCLQNFQNSYLLEHMSINISVNLNLILISNTYLHSVWYAIITHHYYEYRCWHVVEAC